MFRKKMIFRFVVALTPGFLTCSLAHALLIFPLGRIPPFRAAIRLNVPLRDFLMLIF